MKAKKETDEYPKICTYCVHSTNISESDACICKINGVMRRDATCGRFKFDLLKVEPTVLKR